jgi:hypothetical protein
MGVPSLYLPKRIRLLGRGFRPRRIPFNIPFRQIEFHGFAGVSGKRRIGTRPCGTTPCYKTLLNEVRLSI